MDYALVRKIRDTVSGHDYFVSETFAEFLKEHFAEMLDGESFVVHFEGQPREVYLTNDMKFYLTSVGGYKQ